MELELDGSSYTEASGEIEVTLPHYMTILTQDELSVIADVARPHVTIIAAGQRPGTDEIVLLTAASQFMVLNIIDNDIPRGNVFPIDFGRSLAVEHDEHHVLDSEWVIKRAKPIDVALIT